MAEIPAALLDTVLVSPRITRAVDSQGRRVGRAGFALNAEGLTLVDEALARRCAGARGLVLEEGG